MANEVDINLGSFNLDSTNGVSISDIQRRINKNVQQFDLGKDNGSIIPIAKRKDVTINVRGKVVAADHDALRTAMDNLQAALESDTELNFTTDDDRYISVQVRNYSESFTTMRTVRDFSFDMIASYPFWLAASITSGTTTPVSGVGYVINNPGNAPARAKVTITPSILCVDDIRFENTTNGRVFQYRGDVPAGEALVVNNQLDSEDTEVENDGIDAIVDFEGDHITLNPGNNTVIFTGPASTSVKVEFRATYL